MRIAEYKQIDTRYEKRMIHHEADENEAIPSYDEEITVEIPIMGMVYRDATEEEIAESERMMEEMPEPEPTIEEQISDLTELVGILTEVICSD